ncbi:hypothetical protein GCM10008931_41130 [Oceanobacillus oncorhynchi subsp. oncorhynchi]
MDESHGSSLEMKSTSRVPILVVLLSGAFVAILNQTLLGTALPHIMSGLDLDANTVQWAAISIYARKWYYDPGNCFFNWYVYDTQLIFNCYVPVYGRYTHLWNRTRIFIAFNRTCLAGSRGGHYINTTCNSKK